MPSYTYSEILQKLTTLVDLSHIPQLKFSEEQFNLHRMHQLLDLLGNPQDKIKIIHIAGTKGKGSTAALLESVLRSANYKTGLFTSPWLFDFREQIQVNRKLISKEDFIELFEVIREPIQIVSGVTTFEVVTAMAFQYFLMKQVDFAIVEAGLGGSFDATNVVAPILSIITSISFDHTSILGNTISEIARHKAGIIKNGVPVVVTPQGFDESIDVILKTAKEKNAETILVENSIQTKTIASSLYGQRFQADVNDESSLFSGVYNLSLIGEHQIQNASTVLATIQCLSKSGFHFSVYQINQGFSSTNWPCRFEVVSHNPIFILDSAHNEDSAKRLKQTITHYLTDYEIILLFGSSVDKDIKGMLTVLAPVCRQLIFTKSNHPRAAEPAMLVKLARELKVPFQSSYSLEDAVQNAVCMASSKTAIVAAGSVFIAAAIRQYIHPLE